MDRCYYQGIEDSLKNQRKFFERGIQEIDMNLERIKVLKKMEEDYESSVVSN